MDGVIGKRRRYGRAVLGLWFFAVGCSAGAMDELGPGALSISGGGDGSTDGSLDTGDAEGGDAEDDFGMTGPQPMDDDGGSEDTGSTSGAATTTSDGSTGEPEATSSEGGAPESEGGAPGNDDGPPREPGFAMWENCTQNGDCEDGFCIVAEDESGTQYGAYCSGACDVPASDCDDPASGDAELTCLQTSRGDDVCGLLCEATSDCPTGMLCVPISSDGSVGACF